MNAQPTEAAAVPDTPPEPSPRLLRKLRAAREKYDAAMVDEAAARQRARNRAADGLDVSGELPGMRRNVKPGDRG